MEMSPNGGGSSKDIRQSSGPQPASTSHSDRSKGKNSIWITDPEEFQDAILPDFAGSELPQGYSQFAAFMSSHSEPSILRKFTDLNMRNLLSLEAEIADLDNQLRRLDTGVLNFPKQLGRSDTSRANLHKAENNNLSGERLKLIENIQGLLSEYDSALRQYAAIKSINTPPDPANLARLRAWIQNHGSTSNPPDDQLLNYVHGLIEARNPDRERPGAEGGLSPTEPRNDRQEVADAPNGAPTPRQLEGQRRDPIPPRLRIWWDHIKNEMKKLGAAAFIVIGIFVYSLNISAAVGYLILANTPESAAPSSDNSLKACVITWASTLKLLVVYESFYGNYRRDNGPMKYLLFLVSLSTGLCFAVTFALHVLGVNVISGVLVALSLSVVFIRIWAD